MRFKGFYTSLGLALLAVSAACMDASSVRTPTPTTQRTPTPTSSMPTPAASPTSLPSDSGPDITVTSPAPQQRITSPLRISGMARVFEGAVEAAIKDASGKTLGVGFASASRGAPEWGSYEMRVSFTQPASEAPGKVEVFNRSARDGSIEVLVAVPVVLAGK